MEIFVKIKTDLRRIGVLQFDHPFANRINIIQYFVVFLMTCIYCLTSLWFLIFEAKTFIEQVESFTPFITGLHSLLMYCTLFWQRKKLLNLINEFESIIDNRMNS